MSYVVLARKWRPTQFDEVVGQEHVARTLKNAIEMDRVAHAFLFTGARGVGKTSSARILAKALNCHTNGPTATPCDTCISCKEITAGHAIDVFEIDGASNRGINEIRELRESVIYAPNRDRFKIYIIDEVHMLTTEAFNALLKTLEEPPPHAKFIFATTEPQKIPVTILSRCQRYDFKRISQRDIVAHLKDLCERESIDAEENALKVIARQASGGMRDALSLLDQIVSFSGKVVKEAEVTEILGVANRKNLFSLSEAVVGRDAAKALEVVESIDAYGYDLQQFAAEFLSHCRDLVVLSASASDSLTDMTDTELESARATVGSTTTDVFHRMFDLTAETIAAMNDSGFPKFTFEMAIVRMTQLETLSNLDLIVAQLEALERQFIDEPRSIDVKSGPAREARITDGPKVAAPQTKAPKGEREPQRPPQPEVVEPAAPVDPKPETEKPTIVALDPEEVEAMDKEERWRWVVDHLRDEHRPIAMQCEHAHVLVFDDGVCEVGFESQYAEFIDDEKKAVHIGRVIDALFGETKFAMTRLEVPVSEISTIADKKSAERVKQRELLEKDVRENPAVKRAQELFDVESEDVRVQVKLFDD